MAQEAKAAIKRALNPWVSSSDENQMAKDVLATLAEEGWAVVREEPNADISQEEPQEPQPWELPGYPGEPEAHEPWAKVIWETSRADEGTISATGANIVAKALLAAMGRGELKVPRLELVVNGELQDPSNPQAWKIGPGHIVEVPEEPPHPLLEVLERIAEAIENSGADNESLDVIASSLDAMERRGR